MKYDTINQKLSAWYSEGADTITVVPILYGDGDFPGKGGILGKGMSHYANYYVE